MYRKLARRHSFYWNTSCRRHFESSFHENQYFVSNVFHIESRIVECSCSLYRFYGFTLKLSFDVFCLFSTKFFRKQRCFSDNKCHFCINCFLCQILLYIPSLSILYNIVHKSVACFKGCVSI